MILSVSTGEPSACLHGKPVFTVNLHGKPVCMANMSAWQTCLHGKPVCMANLSEWHTCLHGKHVCMTYLSAWQTCLHGNHVCLACTCLPVCASSLLSACLGNFLSVCQGLSFYLTISSSTSVHLFFFFLSVCLTNFYLYACLFAWQSFLPIYLSVCLPGNPFLCLYVRLSVCLPGTPFVCADRCPVLKYSMYLSHFPSMGQIARRRN
jgi:hypothetical protein